MSVAIKPLLIKYLQQLQIIAEKIPAELYSKQLANDMFSLGTNARIAANFTLRGYCPLLQLDIPDYFEDNDEKDSVLKQIARTLEYLQTLPDIAEGATPQTFIEKAGHKNIELPRDEFIHHFILPNCYFHLSMVYATARANKVTLSKGDFDGIHQYPENFSFIDN